MSLDIFFLAEILLADRGVCNLTEVNVHAFVRGKDDFDYEGFIRAVQLATRMGSRITNITMWHPRWDEVQKRDRLLGVSLTGQVEAWDALGWGYEFYPGGEPGGYVYIKDERIEHVLETAKLVARGEADRYHDEMGIPLALLVTTGKPSGTIAQLPTVSSGCHRPYAPYYLRRIRIAKKDPVAQALRALGLQCVPENNQGDDLDADICNTWIFTFPMKTAAPIRAIDERAVDQLERYKQLMDSYIDHNQSITVTVRGPKYDENWQPIPGTNEWDEAAEWLAKPSNWESVIGVAFLPRWDPSEGDSVYPNLPYQPSTEVEYLELSQQVHLDEEELLNKIAQYERRYEETALDADCSGGFCPVR